MAEPTQLENWSMGGIKEDNIKGILRITKEFTNSQILFLINKAKTDDAIKRFTHDPTRFTTIEEFRLWEKNKELYGMTDSKGGLYRIIWFEKMKLPDDETFSAPLNPTDYGITFAIRGYQHFGFKQVTNKNSQEKISMVYMP